ncbi:MAG: antibiotic biosynthesis monooxygenase [Gammaproteobacteria bacterium]
MAKITFIARMTCMPEKRVEFIRLCRMLEEYAQVNEPGTLAYQFFKLRDENRYAVFESFRDAAAEHVHMNSKILAETAPKISACLTGTWEREYLDELE